MRPFGKILTVLFVITYMVAIAEFFVYPAMAKGDKRADKAPGTMPAGYMNAALQRAQNMGQAKKEDEAVAKGKENAKWSQNPNDERGQGNLGKPTMRDPYGFDKDSDRVGSERGRRIEATSGGDAFLVLGFSLLEYLIESGAFPVDPNHETYKWSWKSNQLLMGVWKTGQFLILFPNGSGGNTWKPVAYGAPDPQMEVNGKVWDLYYLSYQPVYNTITGHSRYTAYRNFPGIPELRAHTYIYPDTHEIEYIDRSGSRPVRVTSNGEIGFENITDETIYIDTDGDGVLEGIPPRGMVYINEDQIPEAGL